MPNRTRQQKLNNPRYRNVRAPSGKHWCGYHQKYEPIEKFARNRAKVRGLSSRCKEGDREYRRQYEAKVGKRNEESKSIRITPKAHKMLAQYCNVHGATMYEAASVAFQFYFKYACTYPKCMNPRGARFGRCSEHIDKVVLSEEDVA